MFTKTRTFIASTITGVMIFATDVAAFAHGGEIEPGAPAPVAEASSGNTTTLVVVGAVIVVAAVVAIGVIAYARSRNTNDQPAE